MERSGAGPICVRRTKTRQGRAVPRPAAETSAALAGSATCQVAQNSSTIGAPGHGICTGWPLMKVSPAASGGGGWRLGEVVAAPAAVVPAQR